MIAEELRVGSVTEEQLTAWRKGHPFKVKLAAKLRAETTVTVSWIAQRLAMGTRGHLAHLLYRAAQTLPDPLLCNQPSLNIWHYHFLTPFCARVIEMVYAAERMEQLVNDPEITSPEVRRVPTSVPKVGMGVVETPRGTLFHHYETDEKGLIRKANMIVATGNNAARIAMSVERAAKGLIKGGNVTEGLLNKVEMAFRAYDPCLGCATHSLPGHLPLRVNIYDRRRNLVRQLVQE